MMVKYMNKGELWPNFLVIGAAKSGTTSLYHHLKEHPEVFMPEVKEPQFFSEISDQYKDQQSYLSLFKNKGYAKRWGEASVTYLVDPVSPYRIYEQFGRDVKLICVLRNPARAIYSVYGQVVKMRMEKRPASDAILDSFYIRGWNSASWAGRYAWKVDYVTHLKRYYKIFPKSGIKIFFFEDFFKPGLPQYRDLCQFLGVSESFVPHQAIHNKGYIWKSTILNSFIWEKYKKYISPVAQKVLPQKIRTDIRDRLVKWNQKPLPPMDDELYEKLKIKLNPGVRELEKLLNRDLSEIWF